MKLATENLVFQGLNEGDEVSFVGVETVDELERVIIDNYVILCKKCAAKSFCSFHVLEKIPCPLLARVIHNYVKMNIKSVKTDNRYVLAEFIKTIILLAEIFMNFQQWLGIYSEDWYNQYYEGRHPSINLTFANDLMVDLAKFSRAYRVVETDRFKKFVILVEGPSEAKALPPILEALGVAGINFVSNSSVRFINLKGKDSIQKEKVRSILSKYREEGVTYFLVLDNDPDVEKYINDLKREELIQEGHSLVWRNKFEDNFGEAAILKLLKEELPDVFDKIDLNELIKTNSTKNDVAKSIEFLSRKNDIELNFDDYKVRIAEKLSQWVCREIDESRQTSLGSYDMSLTPKSKSFPEFVESLRPIAKEMERISSEYHVIRA